MFYADEALDNLCQMIFAFCGSRYTSIPGFPYYMPRLPGFFFADSNTPEVIWWICRAFLLSVQHGHLLQPNGVPFHSYAFMHRISTHGQDIEHIDGECCSILLQPIFQNQ